MSAARHICCVISSLGIGGAERVMSLLANEWVARGNRVTLVTFTALGSDAYELDSRVHRVGLDLEVDSDSLVSAIPNNARKIHGLRRALRGISPDVTISFMDRSNVVTLLASIKLKVPVVISERIYPPQHAIGMMWSVLRQITYRMADALVVQAEDVREWARRFVGDRQVYVIPNPISNRFSPPKRENQRKPIVLAVGRLETQKGFDILIRAFALVRERHAEWSVVIVGKGVCERELRALAAGVLPSNAVQFVGTVQKPEGYYRDASVFVLPSRYEGFPNALLEAMASGCAVIATACPGGTSEIITNDVDGLLVAREDVDDLAKALSSLMEDRGRRNRLAMRALDVSTRFNLEHILGLWDCVFAGVHKNRYQEAR